MVDYNKVTKDELVRLLEEANKTIEGQAVEIGTLTEEIQSINAKGAGWLIETPNPLYDGRTYGVQFFMGQAFITNDQTVHALEIEPMKPSQLERYSAEEQKAILERMAIPSAERAAKLMESEFGYTVTYFDGSKDADQQMNELVNNRTKEYRQALIVADAKEKAMQSSGVTNFLGGVK